jgi:hypothetical protein
VIPPSIGVSAVSAEDEAEAPRPRRRVRRPREEDGASETVPTA